MRRRPSWAQRALARSNCSAKREMLSWTCLATRLHMCIRVCLNARGAVCGAQQGALAVRLAMTGRLRWEWLRTNLHHFLDADQTVLNRTSRVTYLLLFFGGHSNFQAGQRTRPLRAPRLVGGVGVGTLEPPWRPERPEVGGFETPSPFPRHVFLGLVRISSSHLLIASPHRSSF
jgi:hypothetical protein